MSATKSLSDLLPFEAIESRFSDSVTRIEMGIDKIDTIIDLCRSDMFLLALNCGFRTKQIYRPDIDMIPLVPYLEKRDPNLIRPLGIQIGQEVIDDIYCCRCELNAPGLNSNDKLVASLLVAQVFPRDLYIGMVTFANPYEPIPPNERKSVMQKFRGLGLLPEFVTRVESCAVARECNNVTLVANELSQARLFEQYGFSVDPYPTAQQALNDEKLIPMHKEVQLTQ